MLESARGCPKNEQMSGYVPDCFVAERQLNGGKEEAAKLHTLPNFGQKIGSDPSREPSLQHNHENTIQIKPEGYMLIEDLFQT